MEESTPWKTVWRLGRLFVPGWQPGAVAYVQFRHGGKRHTLAAGACVPGEALQACAQVYAETIAAEPARSPREESKLATLLMRWVLSNEGVAEPETVKTFGVYARKFLRAFDGTSSVTETGRIKAYARDRLREVVLATVKREVSGLRSFVNWCVDEKHIAVRPAWIDLKSSALLPKKAAGTRSGKQRAVAHPLTPVQVEALLDALPERSDGEGGYVVRARMVFAYTTGLRPATIDQMLFTDIVKGEDGGPAFKIRDEIDKSKYGRTVDLSDRAVAALEAAAGGSAESWLVQSGAVPLENAASVFGRHDYRPHLDAASIAAGLPFKVAPYDLRHARATHWIDEGVPLGKVAFLLGHRLITTTNKYVHPTGRSARSWLNASPTPPISGTPSAPVDAPARVKVARFHLQPTTSFPDGAPFREDCSSDQDHERAARAYAKEWVVEYECAGCEIPECPQHGSHFYGGAP